MRLTTETRYELDYLHKLSPVLDEICPWGSGGSGGCSEYATSTSSINVQVSRKATSEASGSAAIGFAVGDVKIK